MYTDKDDIIVPIELERKLRAAFKYDYIEEKTRFRRTTLTGGQISDPSGGVWSVVSADLKIRPAVEKMVKSSQDNQFK